MSPRAGSLWACQAVLACLALLVFTAADAAAKTQQPNWPCDFGHPQVDSKVPYDALVADQPTLDCFAWQEFIGLNWPAAPGMRGVPDPGATPAKFGDPDATAPTVWETYKDESEVFLPGGVRPKPWNYPPPHPHCASATAPARALMEEEPDTPVLSMLSAFGDFVLDKNRQASGQWLADQHDHLIYYQIKMDKDEFDSIVANGFYNAAIQYETASTGVNPMPGGDYQVTLPAGCNADSCPNHGRPRMGAIEIKAAWRILTEPSQDKRYLTTQAVLVHKSGECTRATMGLVGLHIVHKTVSQPQFIWATFEQVDNVPPASPALLNNPHCLCEVEIPRACDKSGPVFENCTTHQRKGQACALNVPPPFYPPDAKCPAYPVQVARMRPISDNSADPVVETNTAVHQLLTAVNPRTVFQYYELVDVLWSTSPQDSYTNRPHQPGPVVPLPMSGATPDPKALPVANSSMETYVQNLTCLSCHRYAKVPGGKYASDFSFILGDAQARTVALAALHGVMSHRRRHLPPGLVKFPH